MGKNRDILGKRKTEKRLNLIKIQPLIYFCIMFA